MQSFERAIRAVIAVVRVTTRGAGVRLGGRALLSLVVVCAALLVWLALLPALMGAPVRPVLVDPGRVSPGSRASPVSGAVGSGAVGSGARRAEPPGAETSPGNGVAPSPGGEPTAVDAGQLGERLRDILRAREQAYARRDAAVLDAVYAVDCACLRTGRAAIARLRADHALWRGRSFSLTVERLSRVNDSLWIALAVLRWDSFRIEREDGDLVRAVPAARERYRFALVRQDERGDWLLGHASLVDELPP
jgi:hypothetical protein